MMAFGSWLPGIWAVGVARAPVLKVEKGHRCISHDPCLSAVLELECSPSANRQNSAQTEAVSRLLLHSVAAELDLAKQIP